MGREFWKSRKKGKVNVCEKVNVNRRSTISIDAKTRVYTLVYYVKKSRESVN